MRAVCDPPQPPVLRSFAELELECQGVLLEPMLQEIR
jgi:hypothetical protein